MGDKVKRTSFYMQMPVELKAKLRLISQQGKPRRTLTGLISHVLGLYAHHILDPLDGLDDMVSEIAARTESFSIAEMMNGGEEDGDDMSEADAGLGEQG